MAISSASTTAEVQAAFDDAASWEEDGSVAKARALITAGIILLRRLPSSIDRASGTGRQAMQLDLQWTAAQVDRARAWLAMHGAAAAPLGAAAGGARYFSLEGFRE